MTERRDANLFEVLICQIRQDDKADIVLGKALRVLPKTELLKPFGDLLHRGSALNIGLHPPALETLSEKPAM